MNPIVLADGSQRPASGQVVITITNSREPATQREPSKITRLWQKVSRAVGNTFQSIGDFFKRIFCCKKTPVASKVSQRFATQPTVPPASIPPADVVPEVQVFRSNSSSELTLSRLEKRPIEDVAQFQINDNSLQNMRGQLHQLTKVLGTQTVWDTQTEGDAFKGLGPVLQEVQQKMSAQIKEFESYNRSLQTIQKVLQQFVPAMSDGVKLFQDLPIMITTIQIVLDTMLKIPEDVCKELIVHMDQKTSLSDREKIRFNTVVESFLNDEDRNTITLQSGIVKHMQGLVDADQLSQVKFDKIKSNLPRILKLLQSGGKLNPVKLSHFITALAKLSNAGVEVLGTDPNFQNELLNISENLTTHVRQTIQENIQIIDIPLLRLFLSLKHSDFQGTFSSIFKNVAEHTAAYKEALESQKQEQVKLNNLIGAAKTQIDSDIDEIEKLRKKQDEGVELHEADIRCLQRIDGKSPEDVVREAHSADEDEELHVVAKRAVYAKLKQDYENKSSHYQTLFALEYEGNEDDFEAWLDSRFTKFLDLKFLDAIAAHSSTEKPMRDMILGNSFEETKKKMLEDFSEKIFSLLFPGSQKKIEGQPAEGLYQLLEYVQLPHDLKAKLEGLYTHLKAHAHVEGELEENFEDYSKTLTEQAIVEFLQGQVKNAISNGLDKVFNMLSDPEELEILIAEQILPQADDIFHGSLAQQTIQRHAAKFAHSFFGLAKEDRANRLSGRRENIAQAVLAQFNEESLETSPYIKPSKFKKKVLNEIIPQIETHLRGKIAEDNSFTEAEVAGEILAKFKQEDQETDPNLGKLLVSLIWDFGDLHLELGKLSAAGFSLFKGKIENLLGQVLSNALYDTTKDHHKIITSTQASVTPLLQKEEQIKRFFSAPLTSLQKRQRLEDARNTRDRLVNRIANQLHHQVYYTVNDASFITRWYNPTPSRDGFARVMNNIFNRVLLKDQLANQNLVVNITNIATGMLQKGSIGAGMELRDVLQREVVQVA